MNTLVIVLIAAVLLSAAYVLYGCWLANKWGIDPKAETPAKKFEDGKRQYQVLYVPLLHWHLQSGRRCTYRICQYLATVRISKPVTVSTCTCNTLCIHEGNRKKQQDAVRTADHHALCNWNCISRENDFTCTGILSRNSNILSRRITAYHCCFINDPWCDHCSKFT